MKILLIEDSADIALFFKSMLEKVYEEESLEIIWKNNSKEAKEVVDEFPDFDVMLLDGELIWGDDGREVIKVLNEDQKKRTICISGSRQFVLDAKKMGVEAHIDKSFSGMTSKECPAYLKEEVGKVLNQ